jgi:hypothetical protein
MKFWELVAVCCDEPGILEHLGDRPEWNEYLDWWHREAALADNQERDKLDRQMPDELCRHLLVRTRTRYRISNGYLRQASANGVGPTYSAVEIYDRYGGSVLEHVREKGSAPIQQSERFGS